MTPTVNGNRKRGFEKDRRPRDVRIRELWDLMEESERRVPSQCPYCGETGIIRHGATGKGTIRYKCVSCEKTFTAGGLISGSKLTRDQWLTFVHCYVDGDPVRRTAMRVGVSDATVYRMRERLEELIDSAGIRQVESVRCMTLARA